MSFVELPTPWGGGNPPLVRRARCAEHGNIALGRRIAVVRARLPARAQGLVAGPCATASGAAAAAGLLGGRAGSAHAIASASRLRYHETPEMDADAVQGAWSVRGVQRLR